MLRTHLEVKLGGLVCEDDGAGAWMGLGKRVHKAQVGLQQLQGTAHTWLTGVVSSTTIVASRTNYQILNSTDSSGVSMVQTAPVFHGGSNPDLKPCVALIAAVSQCKPGHKLVV